MGWKDKAKQVFSHGPRHSENEDEPVELLAVPLHEGPLVVAELRNGGVEALALESNGYLTMAASDTLIVVRRGDIDAAGRILANRFSHEIE